MYGILYTQPINVMIYLMPSQWRLTRIWDIQPVSTLCHESWTLCQSSWLKYHPAISRHTSPAPVHPPCPSNSYRSIAWSVFLLNSPVVILLFLYGRPSPFRPYPTPSFFVPHGFLLRSGATNMQTVSSRCKGRGKNMELPSPTIHASYYIVQPQHISPVCCWTFVRREG